MTASLRPLRLSPLEGDPTSEGLTAGFLAGASLEESFFFAMAGFFVGERVCVVDAGDDGDDGASSACHVLVERLCLGMIVKEVV